MRRARVRVMRAMVRVSGAKGVNNLSEKISICIFPPSLVRALKSRQVHGPPAKLLRHCALHEVEIMACLWRMLIIE